MSCCKAVNKFSGVYKEYEDWW